MKSVWVIILLLISVSNAFALSKGKAEEFLNFLGNPDKICSLHFYESFKDTELKKLAVLLFVDSCFEKGEFEKITKIKEIPENVFAAIEKAIAYQKTGNEEEAKKIFKSVFSKTNRLDEWILTLNAGRTGYLFTPKILRKKVRTALKERDFEIAEIYLEYLEGDEFYHLLKGIFFMKQRKNNLAKKEFEASLRPERFFYLTYLSRSPVEKFYYFEKAINSNISPGLKRRISVYILDKFLYTDQGFFRKALNVVKKFDKKLFKEYRVKYYVLNGNINRALKELSTLRGEKYRAWEVALSRKFFGKQKRFKYTKPDFYSLLLNSKGIKLLPSSPPDKKDIADEGIRYLYEENRCDIIDFIGRKSPSVALAHYFCGDYRRAIKEAYSRRKKLEKYPYLLYVLYPKHPVFRDDVISLSLARQESLFDQFALSRSGAIGLMQIMPFTGEYIAKKLNVEDFKVDYLFDAETNYRFGSFYIRELIDQFELFPLAAASYNAGPTRIKRALKKFGTVKTPYDLIIFTDFYIPFEETRGYVKKVLTNYFFYNYLYGTGEEWNVFSRDSKMKVTRKTRSRLTDG
ncbi:lytic transglycosylase domain-containing protein [Desulfurobacterium crinifex]